jgi:hypothetical protein
MILFTHIIIAVSGVLLGAVTALTPSQAKIKWVGWLTGLTIASGTYLVIDLKSGLLKACATGLVYTAINITFIAIARGKLADYYKISQ